MGPVDGLRAVGRAELAQQVADVLFTVSRVTTNCSAIRGFGMPAASPPWDPGGGRVVTYHGWPLYTYLGDATPGQIVSS